MPFRFRDLLKFGKMTSEEKKDKKPVTCLVIGAGNRGYGYAQYAKAFPDEMKIVGVADPREFYRKRIQKRFDVPDKYAFEDWMQAAEKEKFADFVVIGTPDRLHKGPAIAFAKKGYHILLEKPMAVTEEDCREIVAECKNNNTILAVCHVLRYIPWAYRIKEIIDSGEIGEVVNIQHTEPVGFWHFAHSFVRGNWRNEDESTHSLMAKCCHDIDLISHWMSPRRCVRVTSMGHLSHFKKTDKPKGAGSRCVDCSVESTCPYSAKRIYLDRVKQGHTGWPVSVVAEEPDIESVVDALKTGPYGRCVYECDNDVMSQQVTNFQFDNGATASLTMVAFTKRICAREVKVYGTKGELRCNAGGHPEVEVFNFLTEQTRIVDTTREAAPPGMGGHGGADYLLMKSFMNAMQMGNQELIKTGADHTLESHLLVFAAEKARKENCVVEIKPDGTF